MVTSSALQITSAAALRHKASAALPARRRGAQAVRAASTRLPPPGTAPPNGKDGREGLVGIGVTLALTGASIGTYMDGIHTMAQVLIYDQLPLVHGGLHTSAVVPPLLAAYYLVLGGLVLKADDWMAGDTATQASYRRCNLGTMCLSFAAVTGLLALSSVLYSSDLPADQLSLVLAVGSAATYLAFDGTKQGLALALLGALVCPASELMLMHIFQVWHYPGANLFTEIPHSGIPSWVPLCYFFYTSAVAQLARYLKKTS